MSSTSGIAGSLSPGNVAVAVAQLQVAEVTSIINAIHAADQAAQRASELPGGASVLGPAATFHPTPQIAPRQILHPTPRYAPRPVIHPEPRVEPSHRKLEPEVKCNPLSRPHPGAEPAFPPVWRTLPPPPPHIEPYNFKKVPPHPDILHKGLLIDIFV